MNHFARVQGMEVLKAENGHCEMRMPIGEEQLNVMGNVHGGVSFALADTVVGIACASTGTFFVTLDTSFSYLRPGRDTAYLSGKADVLKMGSQIAVVRVSIYDEREEEIAAGQFTYFNTGNACDMSIFAD